MPDQIGADRARAQFSALLARAAAGEETVITKRGVPMARLVPLENVAIERRRRVIERIKQLRKGQTLDVPIKDLINEGRR